MFLATCKMAIIPSSIIIVTFNQYSEVESMRQNVASFDLWMSLSSFREKFDPISLCLS